jgi:hypothetical protein
VQIDGERLASARLGEFTFGSQEARERSAIGQGTALWWQRMSPGKLAEDFGEAISELGRQIG